MEELIEALTIFAKYKNEKWPTHCEHDVLCVVGVGEEEPSEQDRKRLKELSFEWNDEYDCWSSFRFGSA